MTDQALDALFLALNHPKRRAILRYIAEREASVTAIARHIGCSLVMTGKHLDALARANLLERRHVGAQHLAVLNRPPLAAVAEWITSIST